MKYKITIFSILIWSIKSNAQSCDNFNKSTFQHTTNFWNWTDFSTNNWVAYYKNTTGATPINPPFKSVPSGVAQPNVNFFYPPGLPADKVDMYPQDGWELVVRNFGINSSNPLDRVANPGFVLYNRFRSMLRFFIYASPNPGFKSKSAIMEAKVDESGSNVPAYFNNVTSVVNALDTIFKGNPKATMPNKYLYKHENNWLMIDMPVAYDPCICTQPWDNNLNASKIQYEYSEVYEENQLGNFTENIIHPKDVIKDGEFVHYDIGLDANPLITGLSETVSFFSKLFTAGTAGKKQFTSFSNDFQSTANDIYHFIKPQLSVDNLPKDIVWPQAFKTLFETVPYAGMVFGMFNFVTNGGNKSVDYSKYYSGFATPREYTYTGSITGINPSTPYSFYTPGSQFDRTAANHGEKPIYDYVLGNFQLLETPELEMQIYMDTIHGTGNIIDHVSTNAFSPRIVQYRLKNPIKYAINPASELSIKSLDVAIEYSIKRNKNFFRYIDTFHTAKTRVMHMSRNTIEDFFHPMLGPVFLKQSKDPLYSQRLAKSGIFIANWPTKWTDTATDIFQISSGTPVITKGYTKEHLFNATFSTQWFNPILYKDYSFLIGDMFNPLQVNAGQNIISSPNTFKTLNVAGTRGLQFKMDLSTLDVKLKVRAILRRTDADATSTSEDVVIVHTYNVKKPNMTDLVAQQNHKWYRFNAYPTSWTANARPGRDFWIHNLNGGNPVFPINDYITYSDTIWINTPFTATKDTIIFATGAIFVNAAINTTNFKVEFRSPFIDYGNNYNGNVTGTGSISDNRSGVRPGAETVLPPSNWTDILNNHCKNKTKYNPKITKSAINKSPSTSKSDFLTTFSLHPNPSTSLSTLTIENPSAEQARVMVYDLVGREVYSQDMKDVSTSNNKLEISTDGWQTGLYIVKVIHGEVEKSIKLEVR